MAHELVIGCLVRLALVVEGETAQEVLSVLEQERGRARVRERLGRGAIGPMEEVVAKVGASSVRGGNRIDVARVAVYFFGLGVLWLHEMCLEGEETCCCSCTRFPVSLLAMSSLHE